MFTVLKRFWPAGLALLAATALFSLNQFTSRSQRFTNLRLDQSGLPTTYLVFGKKNRNDCHVVGRRAATMRRSDNTQPGRKWDCRSFTGGSGGRIWLIKSKRIGEGTVFLVPALDVPDWTFPYLYGFVRTHRPDLELPRVSWIQLYTDRLYQGLYLWMELPFDKRKKDGGSGILRELLTVQGNRLSVVTTRFTDTRNLYLKALADGILPALNPPTPELAWLARRTGTEDTTFVMSNEAPGNLSLLPLPVSLAELYRLNNGRSAFMFRDSRYHQWTHGAWRDADPEQLPFSDDELVLLRSGFDDYESELLTELRAQATMNRSFERIGGLLPNRQASVADLGLSLGGLPGT
jgi:outer membrane protein assembly factor BamB